MRSLVLLLLLTGCGGAFANGRDAFQHGHYPEAKRSLLEASGDVGHCEIARQAEYSLYLGLTHAELGDVAAARTWLERAKTIESEHPGALDQDDRARLQLGLEAIAPPVSVDAASPMEATTE